MGYTRDKMGTYRLVSLRVIFILLSSSRLTSGHVEKVGFCVGTNHRFSVHSLDCQQTYDLLNVTLQTNLEQNPCSITGNVIERTPDVNNQECYLPYADSFLTQIIQINRNCSNQCDNEFPYGLPPRISDSEYVAPCCSGKPEDCVVDQLWLYFKCDTYLTKETSTGPTYTNTEIVSRLTSQPETSEQTTTGGKQEQGTTAGDDAPVVVYSVLGSAILSLCVVMVIVVAVCQRKLKLSRNSHEINTGDRDILLSDHVPDILTSMASPREPEFRLRSDSSFRVDHVDAQAKYQVISDPSSIEAESPGRDKSQTLGRQNDDVLPAPRPPDVQRKASTMPAAGVRRPAKNDDYCLATKIDSVAFGDFHVGDVASHSPVKEYPPNDHDDDMLIVDNDTYGSPL